MTTNRTLEPKWDKKTKAQFSEIMREIGRKGGKVGGKVGGKKP